MNERAPNFQRVLRPPPPPPSQPAAATPLFRRRPAELRTEREEREGGREEGRKGGRALKRCISTTRRSRTCSRHTPDDRTDGRQTSDAPLYHYRAVPFHLNSFDFISRGIKKGNKFRPNSLLYLARLLQSLWNVLYTIAPTSNGDGGKHSSCSLSRQYRTATTAVR